MAMGVRALALDLLYRHLAILIQTPRSLLLSRATTSTTLNTAKRPTAHPVYILTLTLIRAAPLHVRNDHLQSGPLQCRVTVRLHPK